MGAGSNRSGFKGADRPVENVSWEDAQTFCRRLKDLTGVEYRRRPRRNGNTPAGRERRRPSTTGRGLDATMANFDGNYPYGGAPKGEYREQTTDVKTFSPNAWGLYDMHGNVYEWCSDWYGAYPEKSIENPIGPACGTDRVLRGGAGTTTAGTAGLRSGLRVRARCPLQVLRLSFGHL